MQEPRPESAATGGDVLETIEQSSRFVVQQVFKPVANEYRISAVAAGSDEGRPLLYVKQKKLKIKEDIRFRLSPDGDAHLFMIKAKTVFEFRGRHEVLDADGTVIGQLEKDFGKSLIRSHWHVRDPAGNELFEGHESSWAIALLRRLGQVGRLVQPARVAAVQLPPDAERPAAGDVPPRPRRRPRPLRAGAGADDGRRPQARARLRGRPGRAAGPVNRDMSQGQSLGHVRRGRAACT